MFSRDRKGGSMPYSIETQALVRNFFREYEEEHSLTALESLEEGTPFVLTYIRGGKVPVTWQSLSDWLNVRQAGQGIAELAEKETIRAAIVERLEQDLA